MRPGPNRTVKRTLAVGASFAAHAVFVALLVWSLRLTPKGVEPRTVEVQLLRLAPHRPELRPRTQRHAAAKPATSVGAPAPAPSPVLPPAAPSQLAPTEAPLRGLRARLGCNHASLLQLSPEERRRCEDQLASGARLAGDRRLDLSRGGALHAPDSEPYLARRPRNGCKVRAGGDADGMGRQGAATGVACAWSF
jgi:hypothetical protein